MVELLLETQRFPAGLIALTVAHGATDIVYRGPLLAYAWALLPLPEWCDLAVTAAFFTSSLVHFKEDIGLWWSFVLHALFVGLELAGKGDIGTELLLTYMAAWHLPRHFGALLASGPTLGWIRAFSGMLAALGIAGAFLAEPQLFGCELRDAVGTGPAVSDLPGVPAVHEPWPSMPWHTVRVRLHLSHGLQRVVTSHVLCTWLAGVTGVASRPTAEGDESAREPVPPTNGHTGTPAKRL
jgi:hypothetical protein